MKTLLIIIMAVLLSGCATTYTATVGDKSIDIRTYREFPGGIRFDYNATTGELTLEAGEVTKGGEVEAMRDVVLGILPMIRPIP